MEEFLENKLLCSLASLATVITAGKIIDLLLGEKGRSRFRETLILQPRFALSNAPPITLARGAAQRTETLLTLLFGKKIRINVRWIAGLSTLYMLGAAALFANAPRTRVVDLNVSTNPESTSTAAPELFTLGLFGLWVTISYMTTRLIVRRISCSDTLIGATGFWLLDILSLLAIALLNHHTNNILHFANADYREIHLLPLDTLRLELETLRTVVSSSIPTLTHTIFLASLILLSWGDNLRRLLRIALERIDKSGSNTVTTIASTIAILSSIANAIYQTLP